MDPDTSIVQKLREAAETTPYSIEAFQLAIDVIPRAADSGDPSRHVTGQDLCWLLRACVIEDFGLAARDQLARWGVTSTADFGRIVFRLIDVGLISSSPEDRIEDFDDVYDFEEAFSRSRIEGASPLRFSLMSLVALTTLASVVFAGLVEFGLIGAMLSVFSGWGALIGGICLYSALTTRGKGRLLAAFLGMILLLAAGMLYAFLLTGTR